jgi:hypothetical protein
MAFEFAATRARVVPHLYHFGDLRCSLVPVFDTFRSGLEHETNFDRQLTLLPETFPLVQFREIGGHGSKNLGNCGSCSA